METGLLSIMFSLDVSLIRDALSNVSEGTLGEQFKNNTVRTVGNGTYGLTPFIHACKHGACDVVDLLISDPRYIITPNELTKGFMMACTKQETTLIDSLLRNCSVELTSDQFGEICARVSSQIFDKLFSLIKSTDSDILDGFQKGIYDCVESNLIYLIEYGCIISEKCYEEIVKNCSPGTIRLASTKVPQSSIAKTCSFLFDREKDNRMPKYLPVEEFIPLYEEFFDHVPTEDYGEIMYMLRIYPSSIYDNIILRIIKSEHYSLRNFGRDLKTICDISNSAILAKFVKYYPCESWNVNHYRGCIQYILRECQSRSRVNVEAYKEKLIIFVKAIEHIDDFKKFVRSLIPNDNQAVKDLLTGILF